MRTSRAYNDPYDIGVTDNVGKNHVLCVYSLHGSNGTKTNLRMQSSVGKEALSKGHVSIRIVESGTDYIQQGGANHQRE
jgi:hypothetical protein